MTFTAYQIIFIKNENVCLYGELIQRMETRRSCWIRPLLIVLENNQSVPSPIIDVRNGPDVICADDLIHPVLDTDWLPLAATLGSKDTYDPSQANQHIHSFLKTLGERST
jgi:hypothetical protein